MPRPPKLSESQRSRLGRLEPELRSAVRSGDYERAKRLLADIQAVLRPSGHETRLMQAKVWLFEAAMESGHLRVAESGLTGIRQRMAPRTRLHLEATALLAICYLRRKDIAKAEPLMAEVLRNDSVISSERKRWQFRVRMISRFEQEGIVAALVGGDPEPLNVDKVQDAAGQMVRTRSEEEILATVGREVPQEVVKVLLRIHEFASRQLPVREQRLLPSAKTVAENVAIGRTITDAMKRVVWRSLCDPESDVYKMWCTNGMMAVLDRKMIAGAVVAMLAGMKIGAYTLAVAVAALVFKMGLEVFCEVARPNGVLIHASEQ